MENTIENKEKFFAQYWGQENLIRINVSENDSGLFPVLSQFFTNNSHLELTPLSKITDEDAYEVGSHLHDSILHVPDLKSIAYSLVHFWESDLEHPDYSLNQGEYIASLLRSKGYALPFMGLSVEKQLEYKWIKLK